MLVALTACVANDPAAPEARDPAFEMISKAMQPVTSGVAPMTNVVYVARGAEQEQLGTVVHIESPRGTAVVTYVGARGFGPVAVTAEEGDTIPLTFFGGAEPRIIREVVPRRSRPRVIRTAPPRGKTDVPMNARLVIVFSEPVDPASLPGRVHLMRGATLVAGVPRTMDSSYTMVEFVPSAPLSALTDHELLVDPDVRDRTGETLGATVRVSFATGQGMSGPAAAIDLVPDSLVTIPAGSALQVLATVTDANGNVLGGQPIAWSVEDTEGFGGVSVSATGLITATSDGFYIVRATSGSLVRALYVAVMPNPPASIVLEPASATVPAGDTITLTATVRDASGRRINRPNVNWTSSQASVASILGAASSTSTRVVGVGTGTAMVNAVSGNVTATANLTVGPPVPVASVTVAPDTVRLIVGASGQAAAIVRDATGRVIARDVSWASQNESVATVDGTGRLTGVSLGITTLSATSEGITDNATVTVIPLSIVAIAPGKGYFPSAGAHTCALTDVGEAYCWGKNSSGQTGIGTSGNDVARPTLVGSAGVRFSAIDAGDVHSCALTPDGRVFCWGNGDYGQTPTTTYCQDYEGNAWCAVQPVELAGEKPLVSLSTGGWHSCGLAANGDAYCWGWNDFGQLGNGTTSWNWTGTIVRVEGGLTFSALSAGEAHTCGLTTAGKAYCWGELSSPASGTTAVTRPVAVETDLLFTTISSGLGRTCALTAAGAAYCWQPGGLPGLVPGEIVFSSISVGVDYICGVTTAGAAVCWGWNEVGNLGDGSFTARDTPTPVAGGLTFKDVRAGAWHTCGLTTGGIAYCWGANFSRQLGSESAQDSPVPVKVAAQP